MSDKSLNDWLLEIEQQHDKPIDLGLERLSTVASALNIKPFSGKVITVAGTNGKGSFVKTLASILQEHHYAVAYYTSPHILRFNERIVINQKEVTDEALCRAFASIEAARGETTLSYFEYTTLAAFILFSEQNLDYIVLEIGLGGRLDAVNLIAPDLAVISSIGLDHQQFLGDSRETIAYEKAGILRENTPLISAEADLLLLKPDIDNGRSIDLIGRDFAITRQANSWDFACRDLALTGLPYRGVSITSEAAAIVASIKLLADKLNLEQLKKALESVELTGRFQKIQREDGILVVLDVAHNPQAAQLLHENLQNLPLAPGKKRIAVFHALKDKDIAHIVAPLKDDITAWMIGSLNHPRASDIDELATQLQANGCMMISKNKNMKQALSRALMICEAGDQIIVFGSFLVAAELLTRVAR